MLIFTKIRNRIIIKSDIEFLKGRFMNEHEFFYELGKLIYQIDGVYEKYGSRASLKSPNLLWILYALNDGKIHSQKQICDEWSIPRSTANTLIKELEDNGYIHLSQIKGKRRELNISLTKTGKEYANTILKDLYSREKEVYKEINNAEETLQVIKHLAQKMSIISNVEIK